MSILSIIILIIVGGIIYAFRDQLLAAAMYIGFFMGVGALIGWWLFDNQSPHAVLLHQQIELAANGRRTCVKGNLAFNVSRSLNQLLRVIVYGSIDGNFL